MCLRTCQSAPRLRVRGCRGKPHSPERGRAGCGDCPGCGTGLHPQAGPAGAGLRRCPWPPVLNQARAAAGPGWPGADSLSAGLCSAAPYSPCSPVLQPSRTSDVRPGRRWPEQGWTQQGVARPCLQTLDLTLRRLGFLPKSVPLLEAPFLTLTGNRVSVGCSPGCWGGSEAAGPHRGQRPCGHPGDQAGLPQPCFK